MNVIEATKNILNNCELIKQFTNNINIDFTSDETNENFGLSPTGDLLISSDVLGNEKRQHNFVLYAQNQAFNDYERLANSTFLLELNYWLSKQKNIEIDNGYIIGIECSNAMMYEVLDGDINNGCLYQLQIKVTYKKESED